VTFVTQPLILIVLHDHLMPSDKKKSIFTFKIKKIRSINTHKQRELQWVFKSPMGLWYK